MDQTSFSSNCSLNSAHMCLHIPSSSCSSSFSVVSSLTSYIGFFVICSVIWSYVKLRSLVSIKVIEDDDGFMVNALFVRIVVILC